MAGTCQVLEDDVCSDVTDLLLGGLKAPHIESDACAPRGTSAAANGVARFFVRAPGGGAFACRCTPRSRTFDVTRSRGIPAAVPGFALLRTDTHTTVTSLVDTQS